MSVDVKAEMASETFLVEQTVAVRLTLSNTGKAALQVADPLLNETNPQYLLTRPDGSQVTFTHRGAGAPGPVRDPEAPPVTATMDLPGGATWSEAIPLDRMTALAAPGPYRLQVAFTVEGQHLLAPETHFQIVPANVTAFAVAPQGAFSSEARLSTAWAHADASSTALVDAVRLGRQWGNDRTGKLYANVVRREPRRNIRQLAVPAGFAPRGMDFSNWLVWVEDADLRALRTEAGKPAGDPQALYHSGGILTLIDPPVMGAQHQLSVFALESQAGRTELLRIDAARPAALPAAVAYRIALPGVSVAAAAIHFQSGSAGRSLIFSLAAEGGQAVLTAIADGPTPVPVTLARFAEDHPLRGRPLSVYRTAQGEAFAACALAPKHGPVRVVQFGVTTEGRPAGEGPERQIAIGSNPALDWGFLAAVPQAAHLLWRDTQGRLVYSSTASAGPAPLLLPLSPDPAPVLLLGNSTPFVAGVRSGGSFGIEPLTPRLLGQ